MLQVGGHRAGAVRHDGALPAAAHTHVVPRPHHPPAPLLPEILHEDFRRQQVQKVSVMSQSKFVIQMFLHLTCVEVQSAPEDHRGLPLPGADERQ